MKTLRYTLLARSTTTFTSFRSGLLLWLSPQLAMGQPLLPDNQGRRLFRSDETFCHYEIEANPKIRLIFASSIVKPTEPYLFTKKCAAKLSHLNPL